MGWLGLLWACPCCGSRELRPSRFRLWERALVVVGLRPYRCVGCHERCWRPPRPW